jgi:predicted Zn-dependent protease
VWVLVLSSALAAAVWQGRAAWLAIPLWTVALAPLGLLILALQKHASRARRRMGQRWSLASLLVLGSVTGLTISIVVVVLAHHTIAPDSLAPFLLMAVMMAVIVGLCAWLLLTWKRRKLSRQVAIALQVHDFRRAFELCAGDPKTVSRVHLLRYQQAIADAVCGDPARAISALEQLWSDRPRFPLTALALGELLLDADRPERALEVAISAVPRLPHDPAVALLEARSLRRLGRFDEAQAACDGALTVDPENGSIHAVAAALALDRGDTSQAQSLIKMALDLAPGDAYLLVVRAEIALQSEVADNARLAVAQAVQAVRSNPLVFLTTEVARLQQELTSRFPPEVTENTFIE